jgi:hypothetical protein
MRLHGAQCQSPCDGIDYGVIDLLCTVVCMKMMGLVINNDWIYALIVRNSKTACHCVRS